MINKFLAACLATFCVHLGYAQEGESLILETKNLEKAAISFEKSYQFDSALLLHQRHLRVIREKLKNALKRDSAVSKVFLNLSYLFATKSENRKAISYADSAATLLANLPFQDLYLRAINNKAVALNNLAEFEGAIAILIKILQVIDSSPDLNNRELLKQNAFINIGKNYLGLENWPKAIEYTHLAENISTGFDRNEAIIFLNLSAAFLEMNEPDSVNFYALKAKSISEEIDNQFLLVSSLINLAAANEKLGKYDEALAQANELITLADASNNIGGYALGLSLKGNILGRMGQYKESLKAFYEAVDLAKKYEDYEYLADCYESMSEVYARQKNFDEAYEYYTLYDQINDSIRSDKSSKAYNDVLIKYQTAQKEQEIANQKLEITAKESSIKSQRFQIYGLISGLVIVFLAGFIFYNQYKNKQQQKLQAAILQEKERGFETVLNATEEERNRISKDLHDGIGQQLSALKLALANITGKISDENQREDLELITEQFSKSADEVRHISHQMMPRALMDKGLIEAMEDLLQSSFQHTETEYSFEHHNVSERFTERIEVSIYRVVQELINNIIKHANAKAVSVQLLKQKNNLLLFVEDDGSGMKSNSSDGHGLLNIKSRLDMIKGSVNYAPSPESGTSVTVKIPLA